MKVTYKKRLDEIEASMEAAKAGPDLGGEKPRAHGRANADTELSRLALLLAEMTSDAEAIKRTRRIVDIYTSI